MSTGFPRPLRQVVLVQRLSDERLNHRLAAHVQLHRLVEFLEPGAGESAFTR
jgi:hypothetical protein